MNALHLSVADIDSILQWAAIVILGVLVLVQQLRIRRLADAAYRAIVLDEDRDEVVNPFPKGDNDECPWSPVGAHGWVYRSQGPTQFQCRHCGEGKPVEGQEL